MTGGAGNAIEGGDADVHAGETTATNKAGGMVTIRAGHATHAAAAQGGAFYISAGIGSSSSGGALSVSTGRGAATSSGNLTIQTFNAGTSGVSGSLSFSSGTTSDGTSGFIAIGTGAAT